jgi:hypothetical protein
MICTPHIPNRPKSFEHYRKGVDNKYLSTVLGEDHSEALRVISSNNHLIGMWSGMHTVRNAYHVCSVSRNAVVAGN